MSRYGTVLVLALVACLVGPSLAVGQSSTELVIMIPEPDPPITTSDVIRLLTWTPEVVFSGDEGGYRSSSVIQAYGYNIDWTIATTAANSGLVDNLPMICSTYLGPLPAGTYNVTATWNHTGEGLLLGAPSSGIGYMSFTVVPEPSSLAMGLAGVVMTVCLARRRRRSGHAPF